jgi:dTMP kinase
MGTGKGKLIVIEGTDGSGKATQSALLLKTLKRNGCKTAYFDFPRYKEKTSALAANYLNGKYGSADEVDPKVASVFYAGDRYDASFEMRRSLSEGRVVVCNRYVSASMGHQAGKIRDKKKRAEFIKWLKWLEYDFFNIPKPDATLLLFMPYKIASKFVGHKKKREYLHGKKRDIHEKSLAHLMHAEGAYLELAPKERWKVIQCSKKGAPLTIEEIQGVIWDYVKKVLER